MRAALRGLTELATGTPLTAAGYPGNRANLGVSPVVAASLAALYPLAAHPPAHGTSIAQRAGRTPYLLAMRGSCLPSWRHVPTWRRVQRSARAAAPSVSLSFQRRVSQRGRAVLFDISSLGLPGLVNGQAHCRTKWFALTDFARRASRAGGVACMARYGAANSFYRSRRVTRRQEWIRAESQMRVDAVERLRHLRSV